MSFWHDTVPGTLTPRRPLPGSTRADVAIVGAGFTGLWTAYYLLGADPSLRVAVLEAEIAGFGASGRNGGWCSALFPISATALAAEHGRDAAVDQYAAMRAAVIEVARVIDVEGIDGDLAMGGTVVLARSPAQVVRARHEVAESAEFGLGTRWVGAEDARALLCAEGTLGATVTPHCAALHPARLVRGLADRVEARGGRIYEQTRATDLGPGFIETAHGTVHADVVVRATEGYTARLPGGSRAIAPVYSLMIATAPLPESTWARVGLAHRQTWSDHRNLIVYGQRTADGRMVFGGRGAPYHLGSRIAPSFDRVPRVFAALRRTLGEVFPVLRDVPITHRWGGPLGIARDWHASVGLNRTTGLGWAGGYVGDGVSTTNLAGRTLTDLILHVDSPLTRLPWVGHESPRWQPEPLRWIGANAGLHAMQWADAAERRGRRRSRLAAVVNATLGR